MAQDPAQKIGELETQVQKHLQEQKPQLAIPLLREIVSLDARNVNGQANLGVLLFFQGDYTEAMPHMRTALQIQPDLWRVQALLGIAEKRTGNPKDAENDLEAGGKREPPTAALAVTARRPWSTAAHIPVRTAPPREPFPMQSSAADDVR